MWSSASIEILLCEELYDDSLTEYMLFTLLVFRKAEFLEGWKDMLKPVEKLPAGEGESLCGAIVNGKQLTYLYWEEC